LLFIYTSVLENVIICVPSREGKGAVTSMPPVEICNCVHSFITVTDDNVMEA
jgi:hypothetical protein